MNYKANSLEVELIKLLIQKKSRIEIAKATGLSPNKACSFLSVLRRRTKCFTDNELIQKYERGEISI